MIDELFHDALCKGLWRAMTILIDNPSIAKDSIFRASVHNYAYDRQCEWSRHEYMYRMINLSSHKKILIADIIAEFPRQKDQMDDRDVVQWYALLCLFARDGNQQARKAMVDMYSVCLDQWYDNLVVSSLLELDWLDALLFVVRENGKHIHTHPEVWYDDSLILDTQKYIPGLNLWEFLREQSQTDPLIAAYYESVMVCLARQKDYASIRPKQSYAYQSIVSHIQAWKMFHFYRKKYIHPSSLLRLADHVQKELDPKKKSQYLKVFRHYPFPLWYEWLLPFLDHDNDVLRRSACDALLLFTDPDIKSFLVDLYPSLPTEKIVDVFPLLLAFMMPDDEATILIIVKSIHDHNSFHAIGMDILSFYEKQSFDIAPQLLTMIYHQGFCGCCRHTAVKVLQKNHCLPEEIHDERNYDSYGISHEIDNK